MSNMTDASTLASLLSSLQQQITLYGMPCILFFGVGGNMLNCAVFLQKTLRSNSCSIYLIASSVSHTILVVWAMSTNLYSLVNLDPLTYSIAYCKIRAYLISALFMVSRSFIVLACVDRYAVCSSDVRVRTFSRPRVAIRLLPIVVGLWLLLPVHLLVFNSIANNRCIMPGVYSLLYAVYAVICAGILPPSLMIIFGLLARRNLQRMRQRIVPLGTGGNSRVLIKRVDYQIMKMLFVEVAVYCLSTFPFPITTVYGAVVVNVVKSKERAAIESFCSFLAGSILQYINASTAMYSNLITSVAFRDELKKVLMYCVKCNYKFNVATMNVRAAMTGTYADGNRDDGSVAPTYRPDPVVNRSTNFNKKT